MQILLLSFSILPGVMVKYTRTRPKQNGSLIYFRTKQNELKNWSEVKNKNDKLLQVYVNKLTDEKQNK